MLTVLVWVDLLLQQFYKGLTLSHSIDMHPKPHPFHSCTHSPSFVAIALPFFFFDWMCLLKITNVTSNVFVQAAVTFVHICVVVWGKSFTWPTFSTKLQTLPNWNVLFCKYLNLSITSQNENWKKGGNALKHLIPAIVQKQYWTFLYTYLSRRTVFFFLLPSVKQLL